MVLNGIFQHFTGIQTQGLKMIVKRLYMNNPLRNYNYFIVCEKTNEAMLIDPFDAAVCLEMAQEKQWSITKVVNTHEHLDHTLGNQAVIEATGAELYAHHNGQGKIDGVNHWLKANDKINIGESIELKVLDTPGHTFAHLCLFKEAPDPILICGDTLFNAGAGNCYSGDAEKLYDTFSTQLNLLPDDTKVYPGHDYIENNLEFSLDREPENQYTKDLLNKVNKNTPETQIVTTMAIEKEMNPFFRLDNLQIISLLKMEFPDMNDTDKDIFVHLRKLRDKW